MVATGRRPEAVAEALGGPRDGLPVTALDITDPAQAAAVERFGRIDVLGGGLAHA